ncbi:HIT domain-containing protein [Consotaella salsifontis]|uniref:Diadenosine tetraphosphate (Ap4A) hydrolase n=1 Tax=Consotaella salsifontis TaxID=1365950 RepID=A0A1T4S060_9HYPH|nr:HIT domain-containing protein [Consotaella salsifontis]SKA21496.1 Diadenosine tetraphosphate (Ap4A) hydrolase [Consotaella salsifontis]
MLSFHLDPRLEAETLPVGPLGLCMLRLMNDRRWPWLALVPQRAQITEFHDLTPLDQTMLTFEAALVGRVLKRETKAETINTAMITNVIPMFHLQMVARTAGDPLWPEPVFGRGGSLPYEEGEGERFAETLRQALLAS